MRNQVLIDLRGNKTRAEVARDLGITSQGLGLIERGERMPRPALMRKIAEYYNATVQEIFFDDARNETCQKDGAQNQQCTTRQAG